MPETQFQKRMRLIADMPRQADSLVYIMENAEHLSESQRASLAGAADMMQAAAKLLAEI